MHLKDLKRLKSKDFYYLRAYCLLVLFMGELPLAAVDRIIRKASGLRVSNSAVIELARVLEEEGMKISLKAKALAEHAKRKTITADDIRLAIRQ
jgi:histone H3/H4